MAHPHCKSLGQIGGAARPNSLKSVDLAGRLDSSNFKHFFKCPATFSIFSPRFSLAPSLPSHHNCGTLKFDIAMSKFPKMFDADSILRIRGSWDDCDGEGKEGCRKSWPKKSKTSIWLLWLWFSSPNHSHTPLPLRNHRRTLEFAIWSLRQTFLGIYSSQSQDPRICDIASSSNSFENLKFSKMFWRRCNTANSRVLRLRWEWEVVGSENRDGKNRKRWQGVEKMFEVWTRQVAWPSRQTPSHLA